MVVHCRGSDQPPSTKRPGAQPRDMCQHPRATFTVYHMNNEFESPIYPGVGIPEPVRIPSGPMSVQRAAEVLGLGMDEIMELVSAGKVRRYTTDQAAISGILLHARDVYAILLARQQA